MGPFRIETLEPRKLLAVTVPDLNLVEGSPFSGRVASFGAGDVQGAPSGATVAWGDGHSTAATIVADGQSFNVIAANTYAVAGTFPITVTVFGANNSSATGQGQAIVSAAALQATSTTVVATAGAPFAGVVASFTDAYPGLGPNGYVATIKWSNNQLTAGTVVANGRGGFDVVGTNVYDAALPDTGQDVIVKVTRVIDGVMATATTKAFVVNPTNVLGGHLDPLSDTGASNSDGVTAINQPTFAGTAHVYAIVQLFARRSDQAQPVLLGQAIANSNGVWNLVVGPMPDGTYDVTLAEIPAKAQPGLPTAIVPMGRVVIDTEAPRFVQAIASPGSGVLTAVVKDATSGLNLATVSNSAHYALIGPNHVRYRPASAVAIPDTPVRVADPQAVALAFGHVSRFRRGPRQFKLEMGGITDLAGNSLAPGPYWIARVTAGGPSMLAIRPASERSAGGHRRH